MTDNAFVFSFSTEGGRGEAEEKADAHGRKGRGSVCVCGGVVGGGGGGDKDLLSAFYAKKSGTLI